MRYFHPTLFHPTLSLTLLCAAALTACGGGSDNTDSSTSADTAASYAANATLIAGDASSALDESVVAAQAVVATQAGTSVPTSADTHESAMGVPTETPQAVANVPVNCAGGGTATLTITGGTVSSVLNGQLDAGEVYQIVFANCKSSTGATTVNGTLAMTVLSASGSDLSITTTATDLSVTLPRGTVTLNGSTSRQVSSSAGAGGTTVLSSQFSSPSLTLATHFNARSSSFTLSAVSIARQSTWLNGVLQSSSINGTHTLSATLPNGAFSYTVATQGGVTYAASGLPTSGAWTITLPLTRVGVSIANAVATITVDDGKDGTIDRTFTVPIGRLESDAG